MTGIFATPRDVTDVDACHFYHSIELPGLGLCEGRWDLRHGMDRYLPDLEYSGATVLDIGAANGFVTFDLERRGASVIALDQADGVGLDRVPYPDLDTAAATAGEVGVIDGLKNGFWLAHRRLGSRARAVYADAEDLPSALGPVDVAFMGNILQHLRDPLAAVAKAASLARQVVITEAFWRSDFDPDEPLLFFLPALRDGEPSGAKCHSWWQVSAGMAARWLEVLGLRVEQRYLHEQRHVFGDARVPHYTVVASWP